MQQGLGFKAQPTLQRPLGSLSPTSHIPLLIIFTWILDFQPTKACSIGCDARMERAGNKWANSLIANYPSGEGSEINNNQDNSFFRPGAYVQRIGVA